jgi:HprK-related kinase A
MPGVTFGQLSAQELRNRLARGLTLVTGPFKFRVQSEQLRVAQGLAKLYSDFPVEEDNGIRDFHIRLDSVRGLRRWYRPQINFWLDTHSPFKPLPQEHGFAMLEWGMNWCLAGHCQHYLLLHAAVLEKNGRCVILPGDPGAGKSTLTAALSLSGWRLLSDELAVIDRDDGLIAALARPVSLKNQSIDVIRAFRPHAVLGEAAYDTHKGTVSHLKPVPESVHRMNEKGRAAHVVFPRWIAGAATRLEPRSKADAFMHAANHSFNYSLLGRVGFDLLRRTIDTCDCWDFEYSELPAALDTFEGLVQ